MCGCMFCVRGVCFACAAALARSQDLLDLARRLAFPHAMPPCVSPCNPYVCSGFECVLHWLCERCVENGVVCVWRGVVDGGVRAKTVYSMLSSKNQHHTKTAQDNFETGYFSSAWGTFSFAL